jgi:hypothetical protein
MAAFCTLWHSVDPVSMVATVARLPAACLLPDAAGRTNLQVLRVLLKLLETSREPKTLAVGCHDLGSFITHYPAGKGLVTGAPLCSSAYSWNPCATDKRLQAGCATEMMPSTFKMPCLLWADTVRPLHCGVVFLRRVLCPLVCADLGGKDAVLRLVGHEDPGVQKQALLASQKVLLSKSKADYLTHLVRPPSTDPVVDHRTSDWNGTNLHTIMHLLGDWAPLCCPLVLCCRGCRVCCVLPGKCVQAAVSACCEHSSVTSEVVTAGWRRCISKRSLIGWESCASR